MIEQMQVETVRGKALATVVRAATITGPDGEELDLSELFGPAGDDQDAADEDAPTAEGADAAAGPTDGSEVADADTDASDPASPSSQVEADGDGDTEVVGAPDSTTRA
jgi:trigger factor